MMPDGTCAAVWLWADVAADFETADLGPEGATRLAITVAVYLLTMLGISAFSSKKVATTEDFLVAGRNLPLFLCWGSLIATWFGATAISGSAHNARQGGLREVILDPLACAFALLLAGWLLAAPMLRCPVRV